MAISETLGLITTSIPIARSILEIRDEVKRAEAVTELLAKLNAAHLAMATLIAEKASLQEQAVQLREEKRQLQDALREEERYVLTELPGGHLALRSQSSRDSAEPLHYACAHCWTVHKKRSLLQPSEAMYGKTWYCANCKTDLPRDDGNPRPLAPIRYQDSGIP